MKQTTKNTKLLLETKQVGKFGAVGVINTLLDFLIYNTALHLFGLPHTATKLLISNIISTSSAMTFSFIANKTFVFKFREGNVLRQILLFFATTAFGLYVIQNGIIYTLTNIWTMPLDLGYDILQLVGLGDLISTEFFYANSAKVIATGFSFIWNYLLYKKVVFRFEKN
jgi:putative flippase GtrA